MRKRTGPIEDSALTTGRHFSLSVKWTKRQMRLTLYIPLGAAGTFLVSLLVKWMLS